MEQQITGEKSQIGSIHKIYQKMHSERELSSLLDLIAQEAARILQADRASIFLLDESKGELWSKVAMGTAETLRLDARLGVAGAVVSTGNTINVKDTQKSPYFYSAIDAHTGYHTRTLLAAPLRTISGEITGVFEVLNKVDGTFTRDDEEILAALATHAAVAIETAQLVEELNRHRQELQQENSLLRKEVQGRFYTQKIIGASTRIQAVLNLIRQMSDSSVSVLITGDSGTGKELVAKAIHYSSPRVRRPFVALNCAALPDTLVESELFGIEKGVATGVDRRIGKFEEANGGTLFLDEIGDLSTASQAKILRVLQERVVEHVGGRKEIPVDVRVVAATNKDLEAEIRKGSFRQDLYYRLKVAHIQMPALREIPEDIPLLSRYFLAQYCGEMKKQIMSLSHEALDCFVHYAWPGNVRELENEIRRIVVSVPRQMILEEDLSAGIRGGANETIAAISPGASDLKASVTELEKRMILGALREHRQNQQQASRSLGLSRQGLIKKMKRYGIKGE